MLILQKKDEEEEDDDDSASAPRMFLTYSDNEVHTYQLRAYIYQARELHGRDRSGLSDPYGILSFNRYSARTNVLKESICPTWDQTLWIENIKLFGDPSTILKSPPMIYIEFFDKDTIVSQCELCMHAFIYLFIHIYAYMYLLTHTRTFTHAHRLTHSHAHAYAHTCM